MKLFKTKIHPENKRLIQKAFTLKGVDFYEFKNILDMPKLRFQAESRFLSEFELKISYKELIEALEKSMEWLNKGNITKSIILQNQLIELAKTKIGFESIYRLASCHYFYLDENLDYYDFDIGDEKIKLFKSEKLNSFFLTEPINQFLPGTNISPEDLETYYAYEKRLKSLHSQTLTQTK